MFYSRNQCDHNMNMTKRIYEAENLARQLRDKL